MNNLVNNYWSKVKNNIWSNLYKSMVDKCKFCENIIRKINADNFKDLKGPKGATKVQREEKIILKIKKTKAMLTALFSEFRNKLFEKLAVT